MRKIATAAAESGAAAGPPEIRTWETLETFARGRIQKRLQRVLEEEMDELLGRKKSERRTEEVGALLPELYLHGLSLALFQPNTFRHRLGRAN